MNTNNKPLQKVVLCLAMFFLFTTHSANSQGFNSLSNLTNLTISANTGEKPQSKVWTNDGKWWMVMPNSSGTQIWRLDGTTWTSVLNIDPSTTSNADCKAVGNVTHILLYKGTSTSLVSVEYSSNTYQLWTTRPSTVSITLDAGVETATIDIDGNGRMWLASDASTDINVRWSDSPYSTWSSSINLGSGVGTDDICAVTAFNGKIGVLWSNQTTQRFGFKYHIDGDAATAWSVDEIPASQSATLGSGMADDHLNFAVASDGTIYAAVKTSFNDFGSGLPQIALLVRRPAGTWDDIYEVSQSGTRGIVILNEATGKIKVLYTSSESGGNIIYKESSTSSISFSSTQTAISGTYNNVTSTKQNYSGDVVIMASTGSTLVSVLASDVVAVAPSAPTLISPADLATGISLSPTLSWNAAATATSYQVQVSTVSNFATTVFDQSGIATTSANVVPPLLYNTLYYWRVNATNGSGTSAWSTVWSFTTEALGPLVCRLQMEEGTGTTLTDSSPYGNNGTTVASPTWVPGIFGQALSLNGSTQFATVADAASLDMTTAITLAAWIKPGGGTATTQYVIKKATQGSVNGYELSLSSAGKVFVRFNQQSSGDTYRINSITNYPLNSSAWMHIAATYDGTTMKLYVNGIQESGNLTGPASITINALSMGIGAQGDGVSKFNGLLDEIRVYNTALTLAEIQALAIPPSPALISPADLATGIALLPTLSWNAAPTATSYQVQVSTASNFATTIFDQSGIATTSVAVSPALLNNTVYYWRVNATNANGTSAWSVVRSFTTVAATPVEDNGAGYALDFDGTNGVGSSDYVNCGNGASLNITTQSLTIEAWVKPTTRKTHSIVKKFLTGGTVGYELFLEGPSPYRVSFRLNNSSSQRINSTTPYPIDGTWMHVAATYDYSTKEMKLFVNGVQEGGTLAGPVSIGSTTNPLTIGSELSDFSKAFQGSIDEVRVWNVARTEADIKANMTKKLVGTESGMVGYWRFDEISGTLMNDETSNNNDGTMINMDAATDHIWSGAALGDASSYDYVAAGGYTTSLSHPDGDEITATTTSGTISGIQVYRADDDAMRNGSTGLAGYTLDASRFWGVKAIGTATPTYTLVYDYTGNPAVLNENGLKLVKRDNISVGPWTDAGATLDIGANTLTVTGATGTEYALAIPIAAPPLAPTLISPADLATGIAISPTLSWNSSATATSYQVQVSTVANFVTTVYDQSGIVTTSTAVSPALLNNTQYYWRVNATNGNGPSDWSTVWNFTTIPPASPIEDNGAGYALDFDGTNDYVDCGNNASVQITGTAITMEAWIKPTKVGTQSIIKKTGIIGGATGYELYCGNAGFVYCRFNGDDNTRAFSTTSYPTDGTWMHVAATYDGVSTKMYINGVLEASTLYTAAIVNSGNNLQIANDPSTSAKLFQGSIDEVSLWNIARTDADIKATMTKKLVGNEAGLVGYWRFDEISGTLMNDETSNNNDGTMINMDAATDHIWSGAALGDASSYDYVATGGYTTSLSHPDGDAITATTTSGTISGIQVYRADDNAMRNGSTGLAGYTLDASRFWGVKAIGTTTPTYTLVYNYTGNPAVTDENSLKLVKRDNISVGPWTDAGATLDIGANTLTVTGATGTEYALAIPIAAPPVAPTLISPADLATGIAISPTLSWNASATATSYQVQVSTVANFATTVYDQSGLVTTSTLVSPDLLYSTQYYWRVNATNGYGTSAWSTVWSFTTIAEPSLIVTLQDGLNGYTGTRDTYTYDVDPGNVRGAEITFIQDINTNDERRSLLLFDLSPMPAGATIDSAKLQFYVDTEGQGFDMHKMLTAWNEATISYTSNGGHFSANGIDAETAVNANWPGDDGYTGFITLTVPASTIQGWYNNPATNNGWLMIATHASDGQQLCSREHTTQPQRPALILYYKTGTPNLPPAIPINPIPADNTNASSTSPTICATVSDPDGTNLTVKFYGRKKTSSGAKFTIIGLPDTQYYTEEPQGQNSGGGGHNGIFKAQTQWIADHKLDSAIAFVVQLGDCAQNGDAYEIEWKRADTSMKKIENPNVPITDGIPYGICVGNHDQGTVGNPDLPSNFYNQYFGESRFTGRGYYGGHYGSNNDNHYELFSGGGVDFIHISIEYYPNGTTASLQPVLDWADALLKAYPNRKGILSSHNMLGTGNTASFQGPGQKIYDDLKDNPNLILMLAGHVSGEGRRTDVFGGNTVHTIMSDYQSGYTNGGNGYLRIMQFLPNQNLLSVKTYSPYSSTSLTGSGSQFTLPVKLTESFTLIGTNTNVTSGTQTCINWPSLDTASEYEWYVEVSDGVSTTTGPVWTFKTPVSISGNVFHDANALFDNLVNSTSPIGIPTGLRVYMVNSNTSLIEGSTIVNPTTGTFNLNNVLPGTIYRFYLSSVSYPVGSHESVFPLVPILPGGWEHTGQKNANPPNNPSGSDGVNDGIITVPVGANNMILINFGIRTKGGDVVSG